MANIKFGKYRILGLSASVPKKIRESREYDDVIGEEAVNKFIKNVGVVKGHVADDKTTTSDLCEHAANNLLESMNIERDSIDVLLFVSQTPDYVAPSTACVLQYRLGLSDECLAFDINLACSGFVYGMSTALAYLQGEGINRVLLLCGDTVSKHCSPQDRGLMMLSTDAGTATLIDENLESESTARFKLKTIGKNYRSIIVPYGGYRHRFGNPNRLEREPGIIRNDYDGYMNGADVFKFSISEVPKLIKDFYVEFGVDTKTINYYFFHQANLFIMKNIAKRIGASEDLMPVSIDRYGNTGAATIPLTICDFYSNKNLETVSGELFICGFGIGLSLGVGIIELKETKILPIAICETFFDDDIDNLHNETKPFIG